MQRNFASPSADVLRSDGALLISGRALNQNRAIAGPSLCFLLLSALSIVLFHGILETLTDLFKQKGEYSHILLIPAISAALMYRQRSRIFSSVRFSLVPGMSLIAASLILCWICYLHVVTLSPNNKLSLSLLGLVSFWIGSFITCYGVHSARAGLFSLLFLLLMVPPPDFLANGIIFGLQKGSGEVAYFLFTLVGIPVLQQGFVFSLPGIEIEVATECSGIRSSIALLITSLVLGHCYLDASWKKVLLALSVLPIVVFRNGLRIFALTTLGVYVNPGFLNGPLHHRGGIVFYILSLLMLIPLLKILQGSGKAGRFASHCGVSPRRSINQAC